MNEILTLTNTIEAQAYWNRKNREWGYNGILSPDERICQFSILLRATLLFLSSPCILISVFEQSRFPFLNAPVILTILLYIISSLLWRLKRRTYSAGGCVYAYRMGFGAAVGSGPRTLKWMVVQSIGRFPQSTSSSFGRADAIPLASASTAIIASFIIVFFVLNPQHSRRIGTDIEIEGEKWVVNLWRVESERLI